MAYTAIKTKSDRISEKKSRAGSQGGAPKNNQNAKKQPKQAKQADTEKTTYRTSTVTASDTVSVTDTKEIPPIPPKRGGAFDLFWAAYPKKKSKGDAEKAWKSIKPSKELVATMLEKLAQAKTCPDWTKDAGQYVPYPATWLRAKGWEDEYTPPGGYVYGGGDKDGDSL